MTTSSPPSRRRHLLPHYRSLMAKWQAAAETQLTRIDEDRAIASEAMRRAAVAPQGTASSGAWKELNVDVHFLLIAVRHIIRLSDRIKEMAKVEASTAVRDDLYTVVSRFNSQHLNAKVMRDLLEHFDAYAEGGGNLRDQLAEDDLDWGPADGGLVDQKEDGLLILKGGLQINVHEVGKAAITLAEEVLRVVEVDEPWRQTWPDR